MVESADDIHFVSPTTLFVSFRSEKVGTLKEPVVLIQNPDGSVAHFSLSDPDSNIGTGTERPAAGARLTINELQPDHGTAGARDVAIIVSGTGFSEAVKATLEGPQLIPSLEVNVVSSSALRLRFDLSDVSPGDFHLVLTDGIQKAISDFTVEGADTVDVSQPVDGEGPLLPRPRVTRLHDARATSGDKSVGVSIFGEHFTRDATVRLVGPQGQEAPVLFSTFVSSGHIKAGFNLQDADSGDWSVIVTSGGHASDPVDFTVTPAAPSSPKE